jgi:hypothetical protein
LQWAHLLNAAEYTNISAFFTNLRKNRSSSKNAYIPARGTWECHFSSNEPCHKNSRRKAQRAPDRAFLNALATKQ